MTRWLRLGVAALALATLPPATAGGGPETQSTTSAAPPVLSAKLQHALDRSHADLHQSIQPDGSVRLDLDGRFRTAIAVRVDATGVRTTCVTSRAEAERFFSRTTPEPAREAEQ